MPTGYTSILFDKEDVTFRDYAVRCARAFGALVHQRESPLDEPPQKLEVSSYHKDKILEIEKKLKGITELTEKEFLEEENKKREEKILYLEKSIIKDQEFRRKLEAMLCEVESWSPPSKDHEPLKKFMREQIEASFVDCKTHYMVERVDLLKGSPFPSKIGIISELRNDLEYHRNKLNNEVERVKETNKWIDQLMGSL